MKWFDAVTAAVPGLFSSLGADNVGSQVVLDDAPNSVRQVAIIGKQYHPWPSHFSKKRAQLPFEQTVA